MSEVHATVIASNLLRPRLYHQVDLKMNFMTWKKRPIKSIPELQVKQYY